MPPQRSSTIREITEGIVRAAGAVLLLGFLYPLLASVVVVHLGR